VAESNTKESSPIVKDNDNVISETSDIINLEIQDIEGIGPTTAKRLKEAGRSACYSQVES
jgi:predicted flap endonuclease-1-like 5' DNA nuclease